MPYVRAGDALRMPYLGAGDAPRMPHLRAGDAFRMPILMSKIRKRIKRLIWKITQIFSSWNSVYDSRLKVFRSWQDPFQSIKKSKMWHLSKKYTDWAKLSVIRPGLKRTPGKQRDWLEETGNQSMISISGKGYNPCCAFENYHLCKFYYLFHTRVM